MVLWLFRCKLKQLFYFKNSAAQLKKLAPKNH
jgi:hypothetical protein